jgi:selenocysteine lyase/cysteine desulfurase
VEARVLALAQLAITEAMKAGFAVTGPTERTGMSGIVALSSETRDMAALYKRLDGAKIITSLRLLRDGQRCLRLAPHFYNREEEITGSIDRIRSKVKRPRNALKANRKQS